ncbi:MAG: Release factor glutamine methyltransferase [Parcubacteria group bacterium GW2011_GWC2_39_14]|nr:MAG: Release factor glutamine methyltransferase [Parcubacteria group bacterium GW2011_GWC2_39_14]KKR55129.1 MAG: Release factor glutamine methyltransferase [Parcubacteria group bacterium GW2011_GWA2_40_23]
MIIKEALIQAREILKTAKVTSANLDAEVILMQTLKKSKEFIYTHSEKKLTSNQERLFLKQINTRAKHVPVAQITGYKDFFGLSFKVTKDVLVPRPETELLVEKTIELVKVNYKSAITIADIGTGSGAIAISLAKKLPKAKLFATDKSRKALLIAKQNARRHRIKIKFAQGNLLTSIKNEQIDIVVTNLPYLETDLKNHLNSSETQGLKFEPSLALYSGVDGLDAYRKFFQQIKKMKRLPHFIIIEHGNKQATKLRKIIKNALAKAKTQVIRDLASHPRLTIISL